MLALCPGCHAKVTRTALLRADWPPLLRTLWREQHPGAHEQGRLDFALRPPALGSHYVLWGALVLARQYAMAGAR